MTTLRMRYLLTVALLAVTASSLAAQGNSRNRNSKATRASHGPMNMAQMQKMMTGWPMASKEAAMFMSKKYGMPVAMTTDMAMWGKTGPWKRTIVFAREYAHEFPMKHTDVMQQWIDYKAPAAMYDELAMYDGSVVLERTSGEMSARCDKEGANFLAINLAHDVAMGTRTVADARRMYGEQIMAMKAGRPAPMMEKILFTMMTSTNDTDVPLMGEMSGGGMRP